MYENVALTSNSDSPSVPPQVFPPSFRDLPPPSLELFDLDDAFRSERSHLAQLANKCTPAGGSAAADTAADLVYFVREAGRVVGIRPEPLQAAAGVSSVEMEAKQILYMLCLHINEYKKLGQNGDSGAEE